MYRDAVNPVDLLQKAGGKEIADPEKVAQRIAILIDACSRLPPKPVKPRLEAALFGLAVLYVEVTGKLPGYSNSTNSTHFERFAEAVLVKPCFRATSSTIKAGLRRLKLKKNDAFLIEIHHATDAKLKVAAESNNRNLA